MHKVANRHASGTGKGRRKEGVRAYELMQCASSTAKSANEPLFVRRTSMNLHGVQGRLSAG